MLGTGPRGEVVAAFSDQLQRKVSAETVDRGDILSEQREERGTNVESQGIHLISPVPTPRRWNCPVITTAMDAQFLQHGFDPHVAGGCLLAVGGVEGERLLERKQMLGAVAAGERLCDRLGTGVATVMAQGCQRFRVALAGQDRADDARAGGAGDVGDDVVELKIHLRHRRCRGRAPARAQTDARRGSCR